MERLFKKRQIDYNAIRKEHEDQVLKAYELDPNKCLYCGQIFSYKDRKKTFCNKSCAASYNNTHRNKEVYEKVSKSLKEKFLKSVKNLNKLLEKKKKFYYVNGVENLLLVTMLKNSVLLNVMQILELMKDYKNGLLENII